MSGAMISAGQSIQVDTQSKDAEYTRRHTEQGCRVYKKTYVQSKNAVLSAEYRGLKKNLKAKESLFLWKGQFLELMHEQESHSQ